MARIQPHNGNILRGLVGNVVIRQTSQGTILASRPSFSGKKTATSARARLKLANISNMYSRFAPCRYACRADGRQTPRERRSRFIGSNLGLPGIWLTKREAQSGKLVLAAYQMNQGVLPSISLYPAGQGVFTTSLLINPDMESAPQTVAQLTRALILNNDEWLQGDRLVLITAKYNAQQVCEWPVHLNDSDVALSDVMPPEVVFSAMYIEVRFSEPCAFYLLHVREGKTPRYSTQFLELYDIDNSQYASDEAFRAAARSYGYPTQ